MTHTPVSNALVKTRQYTAVQTEFIFVATGATGGCANCEQNLSHILRTCVTRANKSDSMVTARLKKEDPDFPFFC